MEQISYDYLIDVPKLINGQIDFKNKNNYKKKLNNIYNLIENYKKYYNKLEFGNILYNFKTESIHNDKWKTRYLLSLEIFYNNNKSNFHDFKTIDMHGLYSQEMIDILDCLYYIWLKNNIKKICIITGNGNRILYKNLIDYLKKWNIKYIDNYSFIKISLI